MTHELRGESWRERKDDTLRRFEEDGYVCIREFLTPTQLDLVHAELRDFIESKVPSLPPEHVFHEMKGEQGTLKQLQRLHEHSLFFERLFVGSLFEELCEVLLRGPVSGRNMQYFNKPPMVGQPTPPHQDGYYFMLNPCEAVTMWLALEDVDEETGCVHYAQGSHKRGMRPHGKTGTLGFSQGITDFPQPEDRATDQAFPAKAGDLLAHHAKTIHWAGGNQSANRTRQALGFIYYSQRAKEDRAAHERYQRQLQEEMRAAGRI